MDNSTLFLWDDHLAASFPYDAEQVAQVKTVPGAKWDKVAKVWRIPMTSIHEAREFAEHNLFQIDNEVLKFNLPESSNKATGVYIDDDWVYLSFLYDPVKVRSVKSLPSVTWHPPTKAWRVPLAAIHDAIAWANKFDEPIAERVMTVAAVMEKSKNETIAASRARDAEIDIPNLQGELLPYQRAGVKYAANARRCFIADDMGLGKTMQAIATMEYVMDSYPAVVVCPPTLVLNWAKEYEKWLPLRRVATVVNRKDMPEPGTYDVLIVGYSNIDHWQNQLKGHRSYVFDESHYAKTPTAKRTKAAIKMARSAPKDGLVLCLTGTPITNRPAEYASQLDILGQLNKFGGLWGFYRRYCAAFRDRFGQWHIDGAAHLDELNDMLRSQCYIRRIKGDVLEELPPVRHSKIVVAPSATAMVEYVKAEDDIIEYMANRAKELAKELGKSPYSAAVVARIKAESNEHLVRISVLRRLAAKAKMDAVNEWIDGKLTAGDKVVVAAHHREIVDAIAKKYGGLKIQGGMKVEDVEENKRIFQTASIDEAPVMVLSIQAAKTGHTLTAAQDVVFVEMPWTPADVDQTYSRCHRIGQKGSVMSTYILAEGTIDEKIYNLIESKRDVVNQATEGSDVEFNDGNQQLVLDFLAEGLRRSKINGMDE